MISPEQKAATLRSLGAASLEALATVDSAKADAGEIPADLSSSSDRWSHQQADAHRRRQDRILGLSELWATLQFPIQKSS